MVKLASARESRQYGPWTYRNRAEYMNAGVYLFATVVLTAGMVVQLFTWQPKAGLVLLMISLALIAAVNLHDLLAHLAGIDYRVGLVEHDSQLLLVEFSVPIFQAVGSVLFFISFLLIFLQEERGYALEGESHITNLMIAGATLWLLGSILNSCQIYERSDGHVQILQHSVHTPFLLASVLFLVAAVINHRYQLRGSYLGLQLLGITWLWIWLCGSILLFLGGLANLVKVFKMQQSGRLRLEKLRGGAQERLIQLREGQLHPLIQHEDESIVSGNRRPRLQPPVPDTPYKDVLVHGRTG